MILRHNFSPYGVRTTPQFEELWQRGIDVGAIDAAVDESRLDDLSRFLSLDPYYYPLLDAAGEAVALRRVDFMPGVTTGVEILYSIVEDDRLVYLVTVEIYYPLQRGRPGFA